MVNVEKTHGTIEGMKRKIMRKIRKLHSKYKKILRDCIDRIYEVIQIISKFYQI